jgi:hypothetical protein
MLSQCQLNRLGVSRSAVRRHLRVGRWSQGTSHVFSTTTGPLSFDQRLWAAVLHAGPTALVGGLTAGAVHGLRNWDREVVTVLVDDELSFDPLPGVRFFRSRRPLADRRSPRALPLCRIEPAMLLFAAYEPNQRTGFGAVAAVCEQRLTVVDSSRAWTERMRPLRRARQLRALFDDVDGGAQSLAEVDLRKMCRTFGIAPPRSQRQRRDRAGKRRYTDAEWRLADGRILVLEVDGGFHDDVLQASDDGRRQRKLSTRERVVLSCTAFELRYHPEDVAQDLIALGVPVVSERVVRWARRTRGRPRRTTRRGQSARP